MFLPSWDIRCVPTSAALKIKLQLSYPDHVQQLPVKRVALPERHLKPHRLHLPKPPQPQPSALKLLNSISQTSTTPPAWSESTSPGHRRIPSRNNLVELFVTMPGLDFSNYHRNQALHARGVPLPKATSTGTTIVGCIFDGGVVVRSVLIQASACADLSLLSKVQFCK